MDISKKSHGCMVFLGITQTLGITNIKIDDLNFKKLKKNKEQTLWGKSP